MFGLNKWDSLYNSTGEFPKWVFGVIALILIVVLLNLANRGSKQSVRGHDYIRIDLYSTVHDPECRKCKNK